MYTKRYTILKECIPLSHKKTYYHADHIDKGVQSPSIISGHAAGADALGERYALEHGIDMELYPAEWTKYGRMAGAIRNDEMASSSGALIAFWDGKSRGTKIMIEKARKKGLTVTIVDVG